MCAEVAVKENEGERRWTIPQAAVWIRTRDLSAVQALDFRQRISLFIAADTIHGVFPAATDCLREALKRGRLAVHGRRALPEFAATSSDALSYRLLGDEPEMVPESFWQSGGDFTDSLEHGVVAMAPGVQARWNDLVVRVDDCVGHWQTPASVLGEARVPMSQVLPTEPDDIAGWFLAHPDVVVTGVDGAGARVAIESGMFNVPLLIDRRNGVLMTEDGRVTWRAVELALTSSPAPNADAEPLARWRNRPVPAPLTEISLAGPRSDDRAEAQPAEAPPATAAAVSDKPRQPRRPSGQKGHQRAVAKTYLSQAYPDGVPAGLSVSAIEAELRARGTPVSARTIRRAMGAR
jgi:hypothetical protein